jgi:hypothetical protein
MKVRIVAFVFALFASAPGFAQSFDVGGGFQLMRDPGGQAQGNFPGWFGQVSGNVSPTFGIVGEVAGGTRRFGEFLTEAEASVYSFMGGPRFSAARSGSVIPFVQVLFGAVRGTISGGFFVSASDSEFAIQPAGGADVMFTPNVGIRGSGFYRRIGMSEGGNEFGLQIGIVLSGGSR